MNSTIGIIVETKDLGYSIFEEILLKWSNTNGNIDKLVSKNRGLPVKLLNRYKSKHKVKLQVFPEDNTSTMSRYFSNVLVTCNCDFLFIFVDITTPTNIVRLAESCALDYKIIKV
jgi:hypothetical protein